MRNALFTEKTFPYWGAIVWVLQLGVALMAGAAQAELVSPKTALWCATAGPIIGAYIHQQLPNRSQKKNGDGPPIAGEMIAKPSK